MTCLNNRILNAHWVRTRSDLKAGPHIRAVVNCHGFCWIEYHKLTGVPRVFRGKYAPTNPALWIVNDHLSRHSRRSFCGDLGLDVSRNDDIRLFRFSNQLVLEFNSIQEKPFHSQAKNRKFVEALMTVPLTDDQWSHKVADWEYMQYTDQLNLDRFVDPELVTP